MNQYKTKICFCGKIHDRRSNRCRKCSYKFQKYNPERRFWIHIKKTSTCWIWDGNKSTHGYGRIRVHPKQIKAHQFSWIIHNGKIPNKFHVLHKCNNKSCVNPCHLYIGTHQDNMRDAKRDGLMSRKKLFII